MLLGAGRSRAPVQLPCFPPEQSSAGPSVFLPLFRSLTSQRLDPWMLSYPGAGAAAPGVLLAGREGGKGISLSDSLLQAPGSTAFSVHQEGERADGDGAGGPSSGDSGGQRASLHPQAPFSRPASDLCSLRDKTDTNGKTAGERHRGPGYCFCLGGTRTAVSVDADRPKCVLCVGRQSPESPALTATQVCEHWTASRRRGPMPPVARRASLKPHESLALHRHGTSRRERHRPSGRHRHMSEKIIMSLQVPQRKTTG